MRSRLWLRTVALALPCSWMACTPAGPPPASVEARAQPAAVATGARVAILRPSPDRPGAPPVPHQTVRAKVAGHDTLLVVDTGAQGLILSTAVASKAGLSATDTGINGLDWLGQPMKMLRTDHPALTIDGLGSVQDRPSAVSDFSPGFNMRGLGGTLSPQWLATPTRDVMVDLRHSRLVLRERSQPPEPPFGVMLGAGPEPICHDHSGGVDGLSLSVRVVIADMPTRLAIDTGADDTILFSSSAAAIVLDGDAGGAQRTHAAVPFRAGSWTKAVDLAVRPGVSNQRCVFEGRLGLNVLRACVVTISDRDSVVHCDPGS